MIGRVPVSSVHVRGRRPQPQLPAPPSSCARATAKAARSRTAPSPTSPTGHAHKIEALRAVLRGDTAPAGARAGLRHRPDSAAWPCGGGRWAALRRLGLDSLLASQALPPRDLCEAMIAGTAARAPLEARSGAIARCANPLEQPGRRRCGLADANEDELYEAMDWLLERQEQDRNGTRQATPRRRARSCSTTSARPTSRDGTAPLARIGHSRDGRFDRPQIVFGLLTDAEGCPVATEVFEGNTGDPKTVLAQVKKLRERFCSRARGAGRRSRDDHLGPHRAGPPAGAGPRVDHRAARAGDPEARRHRRARRVALRRARPGRDLLSRLPRRAADRLPQPARWPPNASASARNCCRRPRRSSTKIAVATQRSKNSLHGKDLIGLRVGRVLGRFKMRQALQARDRRGALQLSA